MTAKPRKTSHLYMLCVCEDDTKQLVDPTQTLRPAPLEEEAINLTKEKVIMAYLVVSFAEFWSKVLNRFHRLEKHVGQKLCVFLLNSEFDHDGIREHYSEVNYFMREFAKSSDAVHDYQFFPCSMATVHSLQNDTQFLYHIRTNWYNVVGKWQHITPFIDFLQMSKRADSVLIEVERELKKKRDELYLRSQDSRRFTREEEADALRDLEEELSIRYRKRIIRLTSMYSPSLHVYVHRLYFNSPDINSVIQTHKRIHIIHPDIPEKQPLLGCVFSASSLESKEHQLSLLTSEVYFTNITHETMSTISFVSDFLQFNFQIIIARVQILNLCSRLQIKVVEPHHRDVYFTALTHVTNSSYMPRILQSYESLEFLGDAVLSLVAAYYLLATNRYATVSEISKLHEKFVSNENLIRKANFNKIHFAMWSAALPDGNKVAADAVEAIIGAMFECMYADAMIRKSNPKAAVQDSKHPNLSLVDKSKFTSSSHKAQIDLRPIIQFCMQWILNATHAQISAGPIPVETIPQEFVEIPHYFRKKLDDIEKILSYSFKNRIFLIEALTTKESDFSFLKNIKFLTNGQFNNSRLNFLGSNVLKLVVSSFVYHEDPTRSPKDLDLITHDIIQKRRLRNNLVDILRGEPFCFSTQQIIGAFNALIGAIYCDDPNLYRFAKGIDIKNGFITKVSDIRKHDPPYPTLVLKRPFHLRMFVPSNTRPEDVINALQVCDATKSIDSRTIYFRTPSQKSLASQTQSEFSVGVLKLHTHINHQRVYRAIREGQLHVNGKKITFYDPETGLPETPFLLLPTLPHHGTCFLVKYSGSSDCDLRSKMKTTLRDFKHFKIEPTVVPHLQTRPENQGEMRPSWFWMHVPSDITVDITILPSKINMWFICRFEMPFDAHECYQWSSEPAALDIFGVLLYFAGSRSEHPKWKDLVGEFPDFPTHVLSLVSKFHDSGVLLSEIPLTRTEFRLMSRIDDKLDSLKETIQDAEEKQYFRKLGLLYAWRYVEHTHTLLHFEGTHRIKGEDEEKDTQFPLKLYRKAVSTEFEHSSFVENRVRKHLGCSFRELAEHIKDAVQISASNIFDLVLQIGKYVREMPGSEVESLFKVTQHLWRKNVTLEAMLTFAHSAFELTAPPSEALSSFWRGHLLYDASPIMVQQLSTEKKLRDDPFVKWEMGSDWKIAFFSCAGRDSKTSIFLNTLVGQDVFELSDQLQTYVQDGRVFFDFPLLSSDFFEVETLERLREIDSPGAPHKFVFVIPLSQVKENSEEVKTFRMLTRSLRPAKCWGVILTDAAQAIADDPDKYLHSIQSSFGCHSMLVYSQDSKPPNRENLLTFIANLPTDIAAR